MTPLALALVVKAPLAGHSRMSSTAASHSATVALYVQCNHNDRFGLKWDDECDVQVAMATPGSSDTNGSQFFITLDRCDWLNGKHTIFGKVVGTTIFNVVRMQEIETDGSDRPIEPPVIYSTRVFWNPFDDIKPRPKQHSVEQSVPKESAEERRKRKKARKDYSLLSFGEEAEEEEGQNTSMPKIAAAHERLSSKDSKLSATPAVKPSQLQQEGEHKDAHEREEQQTGCALY